MPTKLEMEIPLYFLFTAIVYYSLVPNYIAARYVGVQ